MVEVGEAARLPRLRGQALWLRSSPSVQHTDLQGDGDEAGRRIHGAVMSRLPHGIAQAWERGRMVVTTGSGPERVLGRIADEARGNTVVEERYENVKLVYSTTPVEAQLKKAGMHVLSGLQPTYFIPPRRGVEKKTVVFGNYLAVAVEDNRGRDQPQFLFMGPGDYAMNYMARVRLGNGYYKNKLLIPNVIGKMLLSDLMLRPAEFRKKFDDKLLRQVHAAWRRTADYSRAQSDEEQFQHCVDHVPPIRSGIPTTAAHILLTGMRVPVSPLGLHGQRGFARHYNKMRTIGALCKTPSKLANSHRSKGYRGQGFYTSYRGARLLLEWAKKSKDFRPFVQAYAPFLDETKVKAEEVLHLLRQDQTDIPEWIDEKHR